MLALSMVMFALSAAHLAMFISLVEFLETDSFARSGIKGWAVVYLPSITVRQVSLAKIFADWVEVHSV